MLLGRHFRILQGFRISEETRPSLSQTGAGFLLKLHMPPPRLGILKGAALVASPASSAAVFGALLLE